MNKDHDRLFKELLTTFFEEFIELFFPEFHCRIDWKSLTFLTQELFSGKPKRLKVDLLAKVRFLDDAEMFSSSIPSIKLRRRRISKNGCFSTSAL